MGVSRRMKKQGPPPPLDKSRFAALKKNKLARAQVQSQTDSRRGKKRRASGEIVTPSSKQPTNGSTKKSTQGAFMSGALNGNVQKPKPSANGTRQVKKAREPSPDEMSDDDDGADLLDGFQDAASEEEMDIGGVELDDGVLNDEFLDSEDVSPVDSESEERREGMFSEDEDASDAEEKLTAANIEGLSRKLDSQLAAEAAEAQLELEEAALQTNISGDRPKILLDADDAASDDSLDPTSSGVKTTLNLAPDLQLLRTRIHETVRVLDNFASLAEPSRSRLEYRTQLQKDICLYYGYNPCLAEKLLALFTPKESLAFFEANESPRPVVIRTNTLKTHRRELAQALINRGLTVEPIGKWSKVGLQVFESPVPLGATPEYLAGHYILQAASSFLPVMALDPQEHERILDMASAPGPKVAHIAALMKNTGCIFANDSSKRRIKSLVGNIHRLGCRNVIVCMQDGRDFPKVIGGFDRVLLDAPCSGTGVISKDPSIKTNKTEADFLRLPHLQKQLLLAAIDSTDHTSEKGGIVVYSTCSVTLEENEQVVQYALRKRPNVKIDDTGLGTFGVPAFTSIGGKQFDKSMALCRRYFPHTYNVDGFFVARLKKTGPSPKGAAQGAGMLAGKGESREIEEQGEEGDEDETVDPHIDEKYGDEFLGWDDEQDEAYAERERQRRRRMRKDGLNTRADKSKIGKKMRKENGVDAGGQTNGKEAAV